MRPKGKAYRRPRKAAGREAGPSIKPACHAPQVRPGQGKLRRPCGGKPCCTRGPRPAEAKRARKPRFRPLYRPGCAHAAVAPPPSMRTRPRRHPKRGPVRQQQGFEPPPPRRAGSMRAVSLRPKPGSSKGLPRKRSKRRAGVSAPWPGSLSAAGQVMRWGESSRIRTPGPRQQFCSKRAGQSRRSAKASSAHDTARGQAI